MQKLRADNIQDGAEMPSGAPVIIVAGPTASGKSHLAMVLAERHGGEIVNADSMQIYRELSILTARPDAADTARVAHHLYGVLSVAESCSAGVWLNLAMAAIEDIRGRGRLPIVCGGTGLYLKVLRDGIAPVPDVPEAVVKAGGDMYDRDGAAAFHARLGALDARAAERLPPADRQRLIRAYAVVTATGRTLDQWQADQPATAGVGGPFFTLLLAPERDALYERIGARFAAMVEAGALDEIAALRRLDLDPDLPALKALGVPEFTACLDGDLSLDEAVARAQQLTRNFAKRQTTWFRHQLSAELTCDEFGHGAVDKADAALSEYLGRQT